MPSITHFFPGCGITPFTVDDLTLTWWLVYKARTKTELDAIEEQNKKASRRGK